MSLIAIRVERGGVSCERLRNIVMTIGSLIVLAAGRGVVSAEPHKAGAPSKVWTATLLPETADVNESM